MLWACNISFILLENMDWSVYYDAQISVRSDATSSAVGPSGALMSFMTKHEKAACQISAEVPTLFGGYRQKACNIFLISRVRSIADS